MGEILFNIDTDLNKNLLGTSSVSFHYKLYYMPHILYFITTYLFPHQYRSAGMKSPGPRKVG